MWDKDKKVGWGGGDLNIFDEFNTNEDLKKEIEELKEEKHRDFYFYAINVGNFLKVINLLLFLFFTVIYVYIYLQEKEDLSESNILNPICDVFLWEVSSDTSYCSSVTYALKEVKKKKVELKWKQFLNIIGIIPNVYSSVNWYEWEEITFLLNMTKNRLRPMKIIEEFDILKNNFEPDDLKKIECNDINISDDFILSIDCTVKTRWYENKIVWFDWSKWENLLVSWTSISLAASFINYIKKKSKWKFTLVEFPSDFNSIDSDLIDWYSKETSFSLQLQYNTDNLLFKK